MEITNEWFYSSFKKRIKGVFRNAGCVRIFGDIFVLRRVYAF